MQAGMPRAATQQTDETEFAFARLCDLPSLVEECAVLNDAEWGDGSDESLDRRRAGFKRLSIEDEKEGVILCLDISENGNGKLAGFCALVENDLAAFDDLRPWLASLIVVPQYRGKGLAPRIIEQIELMARENGETELFLHSKTPALYRRQGYADIEPYMRNGLEYWVLGKAL